MSRNDGANIRYFDGFSKFSNEKLEKKIRKIDIWSNLGKKSKMTYIKKWPFSIFSDLTYNLGNCTLHLSKLSNNRAWFILLMKKVWQFVVILLFLQWKNDAQDEDMKNIKVSKILEALNQDGWELTAQRGSHRQFKHPTKTGIISVFSHGKDYYEHWHYRNRILLLLRPSSWLGSVWF